MDIEQDITRLLQEGVVNFTYEKADGSIRTAFGTNNMDIIRRNGLLPEERPESKRKAQELEEDFYGRYFDLEKRAFRTFVRAKLISINFNYC